MYSVILCSCLVEVVRRFASMAKNQRQICHMFHLVGKDKRLLSGANDIKILNAKLRGISLDRLDIITFGKKCGASQESCGGHPSQD